MLGTGAANSGGWACAVRLAEKCGAHVYTAPYAARETFPENHPQFAGFLPAWRDRIRDMLADHDAILVFGAPVFTYHVEGEGPHWPPHARLGALSDDPAHLSNLPGGCGVLGDVEDGLAQLARRTNARKFSGEPRRLAAPEAALSLIHI